jgi:murein L,D-transpeptidase YcbB/YkuD
MNPRQKFLVVVAFLVFVSLLRLFLATPTRPFYELDTPFQPLYEISQVPTVQKLLLQQTDTLKSIQFIQDTARRQLLARQVAQLYAYHNYRPIWYPAGVQLPKTDTLLGIIAKHAEEGLLKPCYYIDSIQFLKNFIDTTHQRKEQLNAIVRLDFLTTLSCLTYFTHLRYGKITISQRRYSLSKWQHSRTSQDSVGLLAYRELYRGGISKILQTFTPIHPQYKALRNVLQHYLTHHRKQFLPIKDATLLLKDSSLNVATLKQHLVALGDLPNYKLYPEMLYDSATWRAVLRFQYRHHLKETGMADRQTLQYLQQPMSSIIERIALNMERLRWREYAPAPRYLVVNIPDFHLYMYEKDRVVSVMKVIVGKKATPTPIFNDTLEYVVFRPTWAVPEKIATQEILPKIKANPSYLSANGYVLYHKSTEQRASITSADLKKLSAANFPYRIIQKSGDANLLGYVKFIFPNQANVYLHDTPNDRLFSKNKRAFSHGCIRVECPEYLAEYVLKNMNNWDKNKIKTAMADEKQQRVVNLPTAEKIPVQLWYQTVWVDAAGMLHFAEDIYDHDETQLAWLLK